MAFETWAEQRDRHVARIAQLESALKASRYYLHHYARDAGGVSVREMISSIDALLPDAKPDTPIRAER